ncbi:hypothetical protein [Spirosoma sp. KUDC1026]|uniref:hypothetical protein n=1 Tax=Spirosoma sp. KUDC1026 TaxID=2745947 RepID=UPI00159BE29F|nr:hypothetical protein [Spirosoma sp. KUDC1026]QKZ11261.1 hypothetical protein HU175_00860 [Spirosoma sp. KUDC1026]
MLRFFTNMTREAVLTTESIAAGVGATELAGDSRLDAFTKNVADLRDRLALAYNDRNLALRIFDRLSRESYGQSNRERFIINELDFEIQLAKAGGFATIVNYYLSELTIQPALWEARSVRKRK